MRPSRRECKREEVCCFLCIAHTKDMDTFPSIVLSVLCAFSISRLSAFLLYLSTVPLFLSALLISSFWFSFLSRALSLPRSPSSSIWPQVSPHASNGQRSKSRVYKVSKRNSPRGDSKPAQTHTWNPCEPQNTDKKILNTLR